MSEIKIYDLENKPPELCIPNEITKLIYHSQQGKILDQNHEMKVYDQCLSGQSVIKFKNGNLYEGEIKQGYMHGKGKLKCFNGTVYEGEFKYNLITGEGRYDWPDGSFYIGSVLQGLRHGFGKYTSPNGEVIYEGEWEKGQRNGQGKLFFNNGQQFEGVFNHGYKDGQGKMFYPSGNYYDGNWKYDKKEGFGTMNWVVTGQKYTGQWKNNIQNGYGVLIWLETKGEGKELRNRYEGQWQNGQRHGEGTFYYADSSKYEGEWKNNQKHGIGILTHANGEINYGEFKNDKLIKKMNRVDTITSSKKSPRNVQFNNLIPQNSQNSGQKKNSQKNEKENNSSTKKKFKTKEDEKQAEQEKIMSQLMEEERLRKLEIQENPFTQIVDISDLTELYNEHRLQIHSDLINILLRNNSTIRQLYKSCQQKYDNVATLGEKCFCLDMKGFWQFCRETKFLDSSVTLAQINRLFLQGSKNLFEIEQTQDQLQKKLKIVKNLKNKQQPLKNHDIKNINLIETLNQIKDQKEKSIFQMTDLEYEEYLKSKNEENNHMLSSPQTKRLLENSANFHISNQNIGYINVHDPKRPVLLRHFIDLIIRAAVIKYGDIKNLGQIFEKLLFEKIFFQLEKQRQKNSNLGQSNHQQSSSNPSQVRSSSVNMSYLEDTDVGGKFKKAFEAMNTEFVKIFDNIARDNKTKKFGFIDRTCRIKDLYKILISGGYIKDLNDKHIIFHVVEKSYDPQSLIQALDQQLKLQEKQLNNNKKSKNINVKLKKEIDKQKQMRLILMLDSEIIQFEMSELLFQFLCRKDRDMAHTKNDDMFRKKLLAHLQKLQQISQQNKENEQKTSLSSQTKKQNLRIWPNTYKDDLKQVLAKERVIKNKKLQEEQRERDQKLREAKERILMGKEDFNVPDENEEELDEFDESEIEVYDDDYLANF